ncbi:MAG TPA: XdhC family protein [Thermoanaerobaculia bacterium]|nr:XdhC family protein [Thermoanaerobaculia bacterium]
MTFFETLNELLASDTPLVTVTVVDSLGSAPQGRGAKMIVTSAGLHHGTIGGGLVETRAIAESKQMLSGEIAEPTRFAQWNLAKDLGMSCGGIVKLYFEAHNAHRWTIVVFGAGHVANALVTLLVHLDCRVICIDPREEWLAKMPKSPRLTTIIAPDMPLMVKTIPENAFIALMTMGHATDLEILLEILRTRRFPYVGVIGSDMKASLLHRDVAAAGLPLEFHCPIGLELGTNHPYEIAVSAIAQMIQVRDAT